VVEGITEAADSHRPVWISAGQAALVTLFVALPSFADIYKYEPRRTVLAPLEVVLTFFAAVVLLLYLHRWSTGKRIVASGWTTAALLAVVTVGSAVLFGHELARQNAGSGSTANQAMSDPIHALLRGDSLYHVHLSGGAPVSPGPGWILLNSPFTLAHAYWLMLPAWIVATTLVLRGVYRRPYEVNLGLVFLFGSLGFWRLVGEGHDVIAIGCAVVLLVVAADRLVHDDRWAVLVGLMAGVIATARIIYLPLPLLIGVLVWARSQRQAVILAVTGVALALVFNLLFSIGVHPYPPLHLFGRASQRQPVANLALGVVVTVALLACAIRFRRRDITSWMVWFAACFAVPHFFIGLGELEGGRWVFATWEGANYILVGAVPVIAAIMAVQTKWDRRTTPSDASVSWACEQSGDPSQIPAG
jgi:hypothetical protein